MISMNELRAIAPRIALYTGVAYLSIRALRFTINETAQRLGINDFLYGKSK